MLVDRVAITGVNVMTMDFTSPPSGGTLPPGTYPTWKRGASYTGGVKVMFRGLGYIAKWDNRETHRRQASTTPPARPGVPCTGFPANRLLDAAELSLPR
jgi:hypothetical protein